MALISIPEVQASRPVQLSHATVNKSASAILEQFREKAASTDRYDIFLSHSYSDARLVLDLKKFLEGFDLRVYVDWDADRQLDRTRVTKHTAATLRQRMSQCRGLLYATSDNTSRSVWMPWELGYFDALRGRCAIIPLTARKEYGDVYKGQEYLGLYPYVTRSHDTQGTDCLWVGTSPKHYTRLDAWLDYQDPFIHN